MTKIYRGRNTSVKFLICCILSFQAIPVSLLKSLTAGHRKIIYMAINRLTKMFTPRQNVVEQPRAHLVADSSETVHPHGVRLSAALRACDWSVRFNPRTHTGCDSRRQSSWSPRRTFLVLIIGLNNPLTVLYILIEMWYYLLFIRHDD